MDINNEASEANNSASFLIWQWQYSISLEATLLDSLCCSSPCRVRMPINQGSCSSDTIAAADVVCDILVLQTIPDMLHLIQQ